MLKLSALRIFVRDLPAAHDFYGAKLGLKMKAGGADFGYVVFDAVGADLVIEPVAADAPAEDQALVGRFTGFSFSVPDIEAAYSELTARGVSFTAAPQAQPWGGIVATLRDAAGNELQIVQHRTAT